MGAAGLARARRSFTWRRVARALTDCYRRAMAPEPRAAERPIRTLRYGA
jgi:hypothetical protein